MHFRWSPSSQAPLSACRPQLRLCQCQLHRRKSPLSPVLLSLLLRFLLLHLCLCWSHGFALTAHTSCVLLLQLTQCLTRPTEVVWDTQTELSFSDFTHNIALYLCVLVHAGFEARFYRSNSTDPTWARSTGPRDSPKCFCKATLHRNWTQYNTADPFIYFQIFWSHIQFSSSEYLREPL